MSLLLIGLILVQTAATASSRSDTSFIDGRRPSVYARANCRTRMPSRLCADAASVTAENGNAIPIVATCHPLGGHLYRISMEGNEDGFLATMSVPTFAVKSAPVFSSELHSDVVDKKSSRRMGLEGIIPGAFILKNALSRSECEKIISVCENELRFGNYRAGKNNHGAMQILVTDDVVRRVTNLLSRHIDLGSIVAYPGEGADGKEYFGDVRYNLAGLNKRWRIYKYNPGGEETFAPHIDAGFPPSCLSADGSKLVWDATATAEGTGEEEEIVSRLTVLIYLNDDFVGGHTKFYTPLSQCENDGTDASGDVLASIKPEAGSILVFPQAVGEDATEYAQRHWPLHEGSAVTKGARAKYVIRSDVLFRTEKLGVEKDREDPLFRFDDDVRLAFLPKSPIFDGRFLGHISSLYNPHMGVENAGALLYSFVRFTKVRRIVEIGAGHTSIWLLQALKDNDTEMAEILHLQREGKCRLMNWPWAVPHAVEEFCNDAATPSLLCVDNCLHQRETATGAEAVAKALGLDGYLRFVLGDAFDVNFGHESIDLLWCDFGVGSRMKEFATSAWRSIKPGGFLICHSTLTNERTREWLEAARTHRGEAFTGIPADEYVEISFLEPAKHYQNSISIFQRRKGQNGTIYEEPLYSEYA